MNITLHLTNKCNMTCKYCYVKKDKITTMSLDTAKKAIELAKANPGQSIGIVFFGGEPLIEKSLIDKIINYCKYIESNSDVYFNFKLVTNGLLLNEAFLQYAKKHNILIALSHDGIQEAHDSCRKDDSEAGTYIRLESNLQLLLRYQPYAMVLMLVNPETCVWVSKSAQYLFEKGFRYLVCSINYSANWVDENFKTLKKEYQKLSDYYYNKTVLEEKFYFSPFDSKISSYIDNGKFCREKCDLGKKQVSIAPDGYIYPCTQFVGDKFYSIGHVSTTIDEVARQKIVDLSTSEKDSCMHCALKNRCNNYCACLNKLSTGYINQVSPVLCEYERMLIPIADRLANKLFKKRNGMFIQKHYNDNFPFLSLIEDKVKAKEEYKEATIRGDL